MLRFSICHSFHRKVKLLLFFWSVSKHSFQFTRYLFGSVCFCNAILKYTCLNYAQRAHIRVTVHLWYVDWFEHLGKSLLLNIVKQKGISHTNTHVRNLNSHFSGIFVHECGNCTAFSVWLVVDFPFVNCAGNIMIQIICVHAFGYDGNMEPNFYISFNPIDIFVWNVQRKYIYWFQPHFVASFSLTPEWMFHQ